MIRKGMSLIVNTLEIALAGLIALLGFLPGESKSTPETPMPGTVIDFVASCNPVPVPETDQIVFQQAWEAQVASNIDGAMNLYTGLLQTYEQNPVIVYNMNLIVNPNE
jgi:hypothetical protein